MPGADGWALARRLSLEHPGLRVLYTSGCNSEEAGAPAVPPSRRGFLCKPYSSRELLGAVHALLGALAA
jgi:DNA-binding response OmpR family regulator